MCKPVLRTSKGKKLKPQFEYNKSDFEITITIPEDATFPLALTLGASVKIPSPKMVDLLVGSDDEPEDDKDKKKFGFHMKVTLFYYNSFSFVVLIHYLVANNHIPIVLTEQIMEVGTLWTQWRQSPSVGWSQSQHTARPTFSENSFFTFLKWPGILCP